MPLLPFRSVVRLGSTTRTNDFFVGKRVECNTVEAVKNSANKLLMKTRFQEAGIKTAEWISSNNTQAIKDFSEERYPVVAKHIYGSRGTGNYLLKTEAELINWLKGKTLNDYIFEKFYNFNREYRLHVTNQGCFYTCRKVLKEDTAEDKRWFRNDSNCNWLMESNPGFDKPVNFKDIEQECVKALKAIKLDIGCFDVKIQSTNDAKGKKRANPEYIIIESGSAPSFGKVTTEKYLKEIPEVLKRKNNEAN